MAFKIKQNDTLPLLPFQILKPDGVTPQDLSAVEEINMVVRTKGSPSTALPLFKKPCQILDQSVPVNEGRGYYDWSADDTVTSGSFEYELEMTWEDGEIQTVPADGYLDLIIVDDIG